MSGPKQSQVDIDRANRRRLRAERKARILDEKRRIIEERKRKLERATRELETAYTRLDQFIQLTEKQPNKTEYNIKDEMDQYSIEAIQKIQNKYNMKASQIKRISAGKTDALQNQAKKVNQRLKDLTSDYNEELSKEMSVAKGISELVSQRNGVEQELTSFEFVKPIEAVQVRLKGNDGQIEIASHCNELQEKIQEAYIQLPLFSNDKSELQDLMERIERITASANVPNNEVEIKKIDKKFLNFSNRVDKQTELLWKLYDEYSALAVLQNLKIRGLESFASLVDLENEIVLLKETYQEADENKYILTSFNEVMEEMGYDVISSERLELSKTEAQHNLYEVDQESAINVYISESGAMMMEVVSTGEDASLSYEEREKTYSMMKYFCNLYPEIEEKLRERGIHLKNKHNLPPDRALAKKVKVVRTKKEGKDRCNHKAHSARRVQKRKQVKKRRD